MNTVCLIGRLTKDPEVRWSQDHNGNQMAVANFILAVDRPTRRDGQKEADFPRITVFGRQAENCERYLQKGRRCGIVGRIQTGKYQDRNGNTVFTTDVIADRVEFLEYNNSGNDSQQGYGGQNQQGGYYSQQGYQNTTQGQYQTQNNNQQNVNQQAYQSYGFEAIQDDDIPF